MDDIFGKYSNGTLDLCLQTQPFSDRGSFVESLKISVDSSNFEEIRADVLSTQEISVDPNEVDSMEKIENRLNLFKENFPRFKWFGKYYNDYEDYFFSPAEAKEFLSECQELQTLVTSDIAILTLRKLIYSFNQAIEKNLYLGFICD
ncbi:MAG TPA: hypothetical protein PKY59_07350 [Pyrinomonadaceae bacterium]|nr:hypothetical protein [Pyrinomonadaceae bacterium]